MKKILFSIVLVVILALLGSSYLAFIKQAEIVGKDREESLRNVYRYTLKGHIFAQEAYYKYLETVESKDTGRLDEVLDKIDVSLSFMDVKDKNIFDDCFFDVKKKLEFLYERLQQESALSDGSLKLSFEEAIKNSSNCVLTQEGKSWVEMAGVYSAKEERLKSANERISYFYLSVLAFVFMSGYLLYRDQKNSEAIKNQKIELENILNAQSAMVVITDGNKMVKCNKKTLSVLGFANFQELISEHSCICELFKKDERYIQKEESGQRWLEYLLARKNRDKKDIALIFDTTKGSNRLFKIEAEQFFTSKDVFIAVFTDITEILKAKEKIEKFNEALMSQVEVEVGQRMSLFKEKAEQEKLLIQQSKMAMMGDMMAAIAHQWKQPLNSMYLLLQMYDDDLKSGVNANEAFVDFSHGMNKQIHFMIKTMDDFRNFFKPSKQKIEFSIADEVRNVMAMIAPEFRVLSIAIETGMDEGIRAFGHPNEFKQVVLNIFSNAKDALLESKIEDKKLSITLSRNNDFSVLLISDNGGGIPSELLPDKLFADYVTTKGEKGTGIGLSLARLIIEKSFDGRISARNLEFGACFEIALPLRKTIGS